MKLNVHLEPTVSLNVISQHHSLSLVLLRPCVKSGALLDDWRSDVFFSYRMFIIGP